MLRLYLATALSVCLWRLNETMAFVFEEVHGVVVWYAEDATSLAARAPPSRHHGHATGRADAGPRSTDGGSGDSPGALC